MLVSDFLLERLKNLGLKHVFGVPGDYVLSFYKDLYEDKDIEVVNTTDEHHAGFAADAYARVNGVGCLVVTYSVGASKVINAVQCAYAERSPVIVISGAPGINERNEEYLLHHMVGSFNSQYNLFKNITCASVVLDNPTTAGYLIDEAIELMNHCKRPIYIELPRDVAKKPISYDVYKQGTPVAPSTDENSLAECLEEVETWMNQASGRTVILAGVELARYGLGERLIAFAERNGIPIATTLLSKSVVDERHELFAGVYTGESSDNYTKDIVENADCLLMLGVMLTDLTLCFCPSKFKKKNVVYASVDSLQVKNHFYHNVQFVDFCNALFEITVGKRPVHNFVKKKKVSKFTPTDDKITSSRLFEYINDILEENMVILADIGDSMFGAADLTVHHKNHFLSPAFYTSMGFAIPGALGANIAHPEWRCIVLLGDGSFQMSLSEISTLIRYNLNPIIVVLNNDGYTTERLIMEGGFNDIDSWQYHEVRHLFGNKCAGYLVNTEMEFVNAFQTALEDDRLSIINVMLDRLDISPRLDRLCKSLSKRV